METKRFMTEYTITLTEKECQLIQIALYRNLDNQNDEDRQAAEKLGELFSKR